MVLERLSPLDSLREERLFSVCPLGMVYHVGSDASLDPAHAFGPAKCEIAACGFLSWRQHSQRDPLEGMNVQPYHHPGIGIYYDANDGKIHVDEGILTADETVHVLIKQGIDFDPDAAAGYYYMRSVRSGLPPAQVVKTHIAAPSCARQAFSEGALPYQSDVSRALAKGHVAAIRAFGQQVIVSVDNPALQSRPQLCEDLTKLFGDTYDEDGVLQETETPGIIRAVHSCGDWPVLECLATGAVDVPHWDATLYGASPILGNAQVVKAHFDRGGMIALGGVPHNPATLTALATRLGFEQRQGDREEETRVYDYLQLRQQEAGEIVVDDYLRWTREISENVSIRESDVARRTFVSFPCGLGSSTHDGLRDFAYVLSRQVADALIQVYW